MSEARDWNEFRDANIRLLEKRTGEGLEIWNRRIKSRSFKGQKALRTWLAGQGVTGYAQSLLVMERFGYPDYILARGSDLLDAQYADRPHLRAVYDAIVAAASAIGEVTVQVRKTYVSLMTPRRTFARIQATTRGRVDLGLRLGGVKPGGRLQPSKIHESMQLQIGLISPGDVDAEVREMLGKAYGQSL